MSDYGTFKLSLVKELTLKAMETGILKVPELEACKPDESAKAVADFFNALLKSIKS